jgi:hypothetical protein
MTQKKPCREISIRLAPWMGGFILCLPFAVSTLERLQAHVCSPMDGKCPGDGESFSTAWEVACIWFYGRKFTLGAG